MENMTSVKKMIGGRTDSGKEIDIYRISNNRGAYIDVSTYGCAVLAMGVYRRDGELQDVIHAPEAGRISVGGDWHTPLDELVWDARSGEDTSMVFSAQAEEDGAVLTAEVRFRMKDLDRLVIDYNVTCSQPRRVYLTHRLGFRLDSGSTPGAQKMRVFAANEVDDAGSVTPVRRELVSNMDYTPLRQGWQAYWSQEADIHPFVELASDETDLALTAYTTMPAMAMTPDTNGGACFEAFVPAGASCPDTARTVYGMDLLYHADGKAAGNPFMFFMG